MLSHINVGSGEEITIREVAELVRATVGYEGNIEFDPRKPDGSPRKLIDSTKLAALGWRARIGLKDGLATTYRHFKAENPMTSTPLPGTGSGSAGMPDTVQAEAVHQ
jgi:GDP-L-fucose synthase